MTDTLPFLMVWVVDRVTKMAAVDMEGTHHFGPWLLETHYNHGVMLGAFAHLPASLRLVGLSCVGAFVLCCYVSVRALAPLHSAWLKIGPAVLVAGIMGNVADRMIGTGGVVDFLSLTVGSWRSPVLNLADLFQWVGHGMIAVGLWRDSRRLWPRREQRGRLWVDGPFQRRHCALLVGAGGGVGLVAGVLGYAFLMTTLDELGTTPQLRAAFLESYVLAAAVSQACLMVALAVLGLFTSHRLAGPVYALKRFLGETLEGKRGKLRLREKDEFQELAPLANRVEAELNEARDMAYTNAERGRKAA